MRNVDIGSRPNTTISGLHVIFLGLASCMSLLEGCSGCGNGEIGMRTIAGDIGSASADAGNLADATGPDADRSDGETTDAPDSDGVLPDANAADGSSGDAATNDGTAVDAAPRDAAPPDASLPDATVNECTTGTDDCAPNATCTDTPGFFSCTCPVGFRGSGVGPSGCLPSRPALAAGNGHTCIVKGDGSVKCWGRNSSGQLGLGDSLDRGDEANEMGGNLPAISLGTGRTAVALTAGDEHTCAILDDGSVKCWGIGGWGQLGLGDTENRGDGANEMGARLAAVNLGTGRTAKAVAAGWQHTCALLDDGSAKCWGGSLDGALGLGSMRFRGTAAGEMGDNLPTVDLGSHRRALAIAVGPRHNCALLDNRSIKCWGGNGVGELGVGDLRNRGANDDEMGDALPAVDLGRGRHALAITVGSGGSCAMLDDHSIKCWGGNGFGQLGLEDSSTASRGDEAHEMGDNLPPIALGTGRSAIALAGGYWHTCALLDDQTVKCWGANRNGQLGIGDDEHRGDAAGEMGDLLPAVSLGTSRTAVMLGAGYHHTCAILDDDTVKCWGSNGTGQLGIGDIFSRGDEPDEMGDALRPVSL